jgi:hypothetical protein
MSLLGAAHVSSDCHTKSTSKKPFPILVVNIAARELKELPRIYKGEGEPEYRPPPGPHPPSGACLGSPSGGPSGPVSRQQRTWAAHSGGFCCRGATHPGFLPALFAPRWRQAMFTLVSSSTAAEDNPSAGARRQAQSPGPRAALAAGD